MAGPGTEHLLIKGYNYDRVVTMATMEKEPWRD